MVVRAQCYNAFHYSMRTLIAFDLETTGLDPDRDAVIEIGAIRFRGNRVEAEWSSLVNPGRPLDPFITQLTGISDAMLARAPRLADVLPELEAFTADLPILGHNVAFDLAFMQNKGLFAANEALDTYDLASVLLPTAGRYNLAALATSLGIPPIGSHRALDDARTTRGVFLRLYEHAVELPLEILAEISRHGSDVQWGAGWVFDAAYDDAIADHPGDTPPPFQLAAPAPVDAEPLSAVEEPGPLDLDEISAILEPGGALAGRFEAYEFRPQQVTMARAVASAFSESAHLMVEAGTGTGKSMAYLVPASAWAKRNGRRVVISTNTLNLQDQLVHKDLPDLNAALGMDVSAAVLKGRSNYLCPRRLNALRSLGPRTPEEMRVVAKLLVWLSRGGSGDRSEINLPAVEGAIWSRLSADDEDCSLDNCDLHTGGACPYYQARVKAENAHLIIVNHALLLADIVTGNRVIPDYQHLIVDEAHHLEAATTDGLSFRVTETGVRRTLRDVGDPRRGLLQQVLKIVRAELSPADIPRVETALQAISDQIADCSELMGRLFLTISEFLFDMREGRDVGPYGQQFRLLPSSRTLPQWEKVEMVWDDLRLPFSSVIESLRSVMEDLTGLAESGVEAAENLAVSAKIAHRSLSEVYVNFDRMIFEPDSGQIYWLESSADSSQISMHAAPLDVGPLVEKHIWHEKESVIMTSATLTTAGEFDFIRRRLKADDAEELALGSPFDFESATLLYLVNDIPEPVDRQGYQRSLESGLIRLFKATGGRGLVLFTSHMQLRQTAYSISDALASESIQVYDQSSGASRHVLLENFRTTERAVLMGTRSFWEGVDVPGPALSVLVIVRLPFGVPSDPIVAARAETYDSPFAEYSIPEAILRFRQGFGRLIRTKSDRGIVVVMDRRITSKSYGRLFVESLPRCSTRSGSLHDLPSAAQRWLNL
jgi:ATP-dependent DNA helicase DinG